MIGAQRCRKHKTEVIEQLEQRCQEARDNIEKLKEEHLILEKIKR